MEEIEITAEELVETIENEPVEDTAHIVEDLAKQIEVTEAERTKRLDYEKEYCLNAISGLAAHYLTARGYMRCREILIEAGEKEPTNLQILELAGRMVQTANKCDYHLRQVFADLDTDNDTYEEIKTFLDQTLVDHEFTKNSPEKLDALIVAEQLLNLEIYDNFTAIIDRMKSFDEDSAAGLAKLRETLKEYQDGISE